MTPLLPPTGDATAVARFLGDDPRVSGVCLVGSQARGDHEVTSDVDVLVVTTTNLGIGELQHDIEAAGLWFPRLSLLPQTRDSFAAAAQRGSLFVLHASREGRVFFDREGTVRRAFQAVDRVPPDIDGEIRRRIRHLRHYRDLERFNGNLLFALSTIYGSGKGVAIALTAQMGCLTFIKDEALRRVANHRPDLAPYVQTVRQLQPFYDLVRDSAVHVDLPFDYHGAEPQTRRATTAVRRLGGLNDDGG